MKKVLLFLLLVLFLVFACTKEGKPVETTRQIDNFEVEFLFEYNGLQIYRFMDGGYKRYFSIGNGTFLPQLQKQLSGKVIQAWEDGVQR